MAAEINQETSINQVIKQFPETIGVFNNFNMDSCCGGARSLKRAATEDGVELSALLAALRRALKEGGDGNS